MPTKCKYASFKNKLRETRSKDRRVLKTLTFADENQKKWVCQHYKKNRKNPTPFEQKIGNYLCTHHVKFEFQRPFIINNHIYYADFYLPAYNAIIESDGHQHDNSEHDRIRDKDFESIGIKTYRIGNWKLDEEGILKKFLSYIQLSQVSFK